MKTLAYILFFTLLGFTTQAQQITVSPTEIQNNFEGIDLTDNAVDLESHISVTNNTSESIDLVWTRVVTEGCPEEWDTQVCDNNLCYFYTVYSNVADDLGLFAPFTLESEETFDGFIFHVLPRMTPGCCRVKIEFATIAEPDSIIETAVFDISVNMPQCNFGTSTEEIAEAQLVEIYPNPTSDAFTLTNNDVVKQVELYNALGQRLRSFDFINGEYFNVSDLNAGIYSVVLKNDRGEALHTLNLQRI